MFFRVGDRGVCKDCKGIFSECLIIQYRFLIMDVIVGNWKLKKNYLVGFKRRGIAKFQNQCDRRVWGEYIRGVYQMWDEWRLGVVLRRVEEYKEVWQWNEDIYDKVKIKQDRFKEFMVCQLEEDKERCKERYRGVIRKVKKAVAKVKFKFMKICMDVQRLKREGRVFINLLILGIKG